LSQPFITTLKKSRPQTKIIFLTTPAGEELLRQLQDIDEFVIFNPGWFSLMSSQPPAFAEGRLQLGSSFFSLIRCLRRHVCDVIVDLRGDFRHILAARIAQPRAWLLSYGTTGGGFLLDCEAMESEKVHAAQRNMGLLSSLLTNCHAEPSATRGAATRGGGRSISLSPKISSSPLSPSLSFLRSKKENRWIAFHMGAKTPAKLWPISHWADLLRRLMTEKDLHFFMIGDAASHQIFQKLEQQMEPIEQQRITNLYEKLPLSQLGTFLRMCDLLVSVDSGPVHIAAAHGVKTIVLFSGTTEPEIWRPLSPKTTILNHVVSCSPCHQRACPQERHFCMEELTPDSVSECVSASINRVH